MRNMKKSNLWRDVNTRTSFSIKVHWESVSKRIAARIPPPQPVAIDEKVAETTLPWLWIAVSAPHEVTQWTQRKASTIYAKYYC